MKAFFNDRKIITFSICLSLGIFIGNYFFQSMVVYIYAAVIALTALVLVLFKRLEIKVLLYCAAFCIGIFSISVSKYVIISQQDHFFVGSSECSVYVVSVTQDEDAKIIADNVVIDGEKDAGKVALNIYGALPFKIEAGQTLELTVKFSKPKGLRNPYGFDYNFYLQQNGIAMSASANAATCKLISESSVGIRGVFIGAKNVFASKIEELYTENAAIIKGIILGDKTDISESVIENFRVSGIAHVFAISGLHIGFLVGFLLWLLRRLMKLKDKTVLLIIASILICYCAITNFSASIVRASIMAEIVLGARIVGKRQDTLSSLFAAGLIILLLDPFSLFKVGFQLSFCAVLGILLLRDICLKIFAKLPKYIKEPLSVTVGAQCGIFLVSAYYFYNVSLYSILVNLVVLPIIGVLVIFSLISVLFGLISSILAAPFVIIANFLLYILSAITTFVSSLPYASVIIGRPPEYLIAAVFLIMLILSPYVLASVYKKSIAIILALALLFGVIIFKQNAAFKGLQITMFDVGQGDSAYIETPGGYKILIDGGPVYDDYNAGEGVLLPYFYGSAISNIDLVIATHSHSDHVGGLVVVAEELCIGKYIEPIGAVETGDDTAYLHLKDELNSKNITIEKLKAGDLIELDDGVKIEIFYPDTQSDFGENEGALVFKITYNKFSMLFTADISADIEKEILGALSYMNVLKVAHHGSKYSTSIEFLNVIKPQTAVISVGTNNYGQPAEETIERLTLSGANIYRTDSNGAVIINVYDDKYTIEPMIK